jgi:TRAP-type mannitol/chloroaromatic compound transport system permease small subunit
VAEAKAFAREEDMRTLLRASEVIDWMNAQFGKAANILVLVACFVSAGNAMSRYAFSLSSNGFLEIQWYMFAIISLSS